MARPKKKIDWKLFEDMCEIHCTQEEISNILRVDPDTLRVRAREYYNESDFSVIYKIFSSKGKSSLRRFQYQMSKRSCPMAIWLGKVWLDQRDNTEEIRIHSDTFKQFGAVMSQLSSLQAEKRS